MNVTRTAANGQVTSTCGVYRKTKTVPDKGLGRAALAAWETNHQHPEEKP